MIEVDYFSEESIKNALTGLDVVISTVAIAALDIQGKIAAAAKNAEVKLFVPSEFGNITEGDTEGLHGTKSKFQGQLKALGLPYAVFYTGKFPDSGWSSYVFFIHFNIWAIPFRLTRDQKCLLHRYHERESVRWWRWEYATYVHVQT